MTDGQLCSVDTGMGPAWHCCSFSARFETSTYVAQANLEFVILLLQPPGAGVTDEPTMLRLSSVVLSRAEPLMVSRVPSVHGWR